MQHTHVLLETHAKDIAIKTDTPIDLEVYAELFKYKVYEAYKPSTLSTTRDYIKFLIDDNARLSSEQRSYLDNELQTRLPDFVDQKKLLCFDSNFECGNLDSAWLQSEKEYNLLLKVDTNTRGNNHWFYFKVLNWRPEQEVKFNMINMTRDLSVFYSRGMTVLTRTESHDGKYKSEWRSDKNIVTSVHFSHQNKIIRSYSKHDPKVPASFYSSVKFKATFPEFEQLNPDSTGVLD